MHLRPIVASSLILALILGSAPLLAAFPPEAYEDAVAILANANIIDGSRAGNPRVYEVVNRAEALKIILRSKSAMVEEIAAVSSSMPPISLFPDVDQQAWYAPYVEVGFRYGLVKGYPDGFLWPQAGIKVAEAAAMIARAYGFVRSGVPFQSSPDLPNAAGQWYTDAVSGVLQRNGVMPGSRLRVGDSMTRGELFDMAYRMIVAEKNGFTMSSGQPRSGAVDTGAPSPVASSEQFASAKPFAISIPSIGLTDLTVAHPDDATTQRGVLAPLKDGVGHLFGYPGDGGKIMIYGHSSGYPWDLSAFTKIFRTINTVNVGDRVFVTYEGELHVYEVTEKRAVSSKDMSDFEPDDSGEQLILYTCWPPDNITYRYLVFAKPVERVAVR